MGSKPHLKRNRILKRGGLKAAQKRDKNGTILMNRTEYDLS